MPRGGRCCRDTRLTAWRAGAMLTAVSGTADHVPRNRAAWDRWAEEYAGPGLRNWAVAEPSWGIWGIAKAQAGVLPVDLEKGQAQHRVGLRHVACQNSRRASDLGFYPQHS